MNEREQGWFELLIDALSVGQPSPELLVRYLLAPEALTRDELVLLEDRIAQDPVIADQVEVLRRLLFPMQLTSTALPGMQPSSWLNPIPNLSEAG